MGSYLHHWCTFGNSFELPCPRCLMVKTAFTIRDWHGVLCGDFVGNSSFTKKARRLSSAGLALVLWILLVNAAAAARIEQIVHQIFTQGTGHVVTGVAQCTVLIAQIPGTIVVACLIPDVAGQGITQKAG